MISEPAMDDRNFGGTIADLFVKNLERTARRDSGS